MFKIVQERNKCIGCGACAAACPDYWQMEDSDGLATMKNSVQNADGNFELEIGSDSIACNREAVDSCPVRIIKIVE